MNDATNWTSIDLYYKGFHIKKSVPDNVSPEVLKQTIDKYEEMGFKPSWNEDTNKKVQAPKSVEDTAMCPIHSVKMFHFEKNGKEWWSHKLDDDTWCNGKRRPEA